MRTLRALAAARAGLLRQGRSWPTSAAAPRLQHTQPQQQPAAAAAGGAAGPPPEQQPEQVQAAAAAAAPPPKPRQRFSFCRMCGGALDLVLPQGDSRWRHVCGACGYTDYQNPRLVVGCIVEHQGRILLCRRGIEPQRGLWTVPAGYLECAESSAEGAARETWEEAGARVAVDAPYCHYDIPGIGQAYLLFRARLAPPFTFAARAPESLEARLFAPAELPWGQLAFSSVALALRSYLEDLERGTFSVHHGVIHKQPGSGPNDSYQLRDHVALPTPLPSRPPPA